LATSTTVTGVVYDDPEAGFVIAIDGGTFGGLTRMCTGADVLLAPSCPSRRPSACSSPASVRSR
jgi:hypothetical protein